MKKTLVAVAALAFVGAAFAQSTVTLYGRIDASVGKNHVKGFGNLAGTAQDLGPDVGSGSNSGSRWGMTGVEDLGGGLKAIFTLESGFNVDTGLSAQGGRLFGRKAVVGLNGGFGMLTVGRNLTLMADYGWAVTGGYANYDAWSGFAAPAPGANTGTFGNQFSVATDAVRKDNSVRYVSPSMGGFSVGLMWAPGENGIVNGARNTNYWSAVGDYSNGPIQVNLTYESDRVTAAPALVPTPGAINQKQWVLAGKYDFGPAALSASYERGDLGASRDRGYAFGLTAPLGPVNLAVEYARERTETAGAYVSKAHAVNVRVSYPLSKRTDVYAFLSDGKSNNSTGGSQDLTRYRVGVRHAF